MRDILLQCSGVACVFGFSAIGNAVGTRGRHFGWMVLGAVAVMAVAGY